MLEKEEEPNGLLPSWEISGGVVGLDSESQHTVEKERGSQERNFSSMGQSMKGSRVSF